MAVFGTRPEAIKLAPVIRAVEADPDLRSRVVVTAQHRDLLDQALAPFGIVPDLDLDLMRPGHTLAELTCRVLDGMDRALAEERPDLILVQGDTTTVFVAALAAFYRGVPVGHVEAGLRSFDLSMPEERNRITVDRIAALLFCPDERSAAQLESEGVAGRRMVVGDVMADANRIFAPIARERSHILAELGVSAGAYVLVTVHREANVRLDRLTRIAAALDALELPLVFPAHPRTRDALRDVPHRFETIEPVGFLDFAALASQARVILTDSGGVQKEAYWYHVPCVTMRPSTEWVDTVETGANVLVDDDPEAIGRAAREARFPASAPPLYGDGHASERVAAALYASRP
jgi:UDP-N-acetylglucosamine 2-epimerase